MKEKILEYIKNHGGSVNVTQMAQDLGQIETRQYINFEFREEIWQLTAAGDLEFGDSFLTLKLAL